MQAQSSARASGGILTSLIRSTLFKDLVRVNIGSLRPEAGRNAVKTLMGDDPEVFFGIMSSLPVILDNVTGALTEAAVQIRDKYPPELLKPFLKSLADAIDKEGARECGRAWSDLAATMLRASPELRTIVVRAVLAEGPKIMAGSVNSFSRAVNNITRDDPAAFGTFMSTAMEHIDGKELGSAAAVMANALLDQKMHMASWAWKLVRDRVKKRFGR